MSVSLVGSTTSIPSTVPHRFQPAFQQAIDEGQVRYGGELAGLLAALDQARSDYHTGVGQANAAADMIQNASLTQQHALAAPDNPLTHILAGYNPNAAGAAGVVARNLGLTVGAAQPLLAQHAVDAATAAKYQGNQLRQTYLGDVGKIQTQGQSLQDQLGSYISGRYGSLVTEDRNRRAEANKAAAQMANSVKTAQISHGLNPATGKYDPAMNKPPAGPSTIARPPANFTGSPADWNGMPRAARDQWVAQHPTSKGPAGKSPFLNPNQQSTQVARIKGAQQNVTRLMSHPQAVPAEVATLLRAGKVDGVKYTQPQIDVAFDLFRNNGKLSQRGVRVLHNVLKVQARGNFALAPAPNPAGGNPIATLVQGAKGALG